MPASKDAKVSADLFFIIPDDAGEYEGHVQITAENTDALFGGFDDVLDKVKNRGYKPRPSKSFNNTYVKVEPKKAATPKASTATTVDAMAAAAQDTFGKRCPIDDTPMEYRPAPAGALVKNGPFTGKPLPNSWECPRCQKRVWEKPAARGNTNEIPY